VCALVCVCTCVCVHVCVCVCVGYFTAAPKLPWRSFLAPGAAAPGAGRCGGGWLNVECPFLFSERRSMSSSELSVVSPSSYLPRCYIRTSAQRTRWNPSIPESRGAAKPPLRARGGGARRSGWRGLRALAAVGDGRALVGVEVLCPGRHRISSHRGAHHVLRTQQRRHASTSPPGQIHQRTWSEPTQKARHANKTKIYAIPRTNTHRGD
jgi:hypothetical protein